MMKNDNKTTVYGKNSEFNLILAARNNDEEAFDRLYREYLPVVFWCVSNFSPPESEKDDLVQEGVIGLIKAIRTYDNESSSFNTYASLCIKRSVISALRKLNRQNRVIQMPDIAETDITPGSQAVDKEDYKTIYRQFVGLLSPFEKQTLSLYISGMSYTAMAEKLGCSVKSVDNAITRIKLKLKKKRGNKSERRT